MLLHRAPLRGRLFRPGPPVRVRGTTRSGSRFSKAAVEFMRAAGKRPDVVHCCGWQTGLVPVLLREQYGREMPGQRVCYTIHNFRHQGTSGEEVLWALGLAGPTTSSTPTGVW
jgi:glycogen synthase